MTGIFSSLDPVVKQNEGDLPLIATMPSVESMAKIMYTMLSLTATLVSDPIKCSLRNEKSKLPCQVLFWREQDRLRKETTLILQQ